MSGELPYHTMSEGETTMDIDSSEMSLYQMDGPGLGGVKPGLEIPGMCWGKPELGDIPVPVSEEVVISGPGVPSDPSRVNGDPGVQAGILEDQTVEEFMVEIPLDQDEDDTSDSVLSQEPQESVYTILEPCMPAEGARWTAHMYPTISGDEESVDSGLGSSERSSILSKKNSLTRLPSQDEEFGDMSSWTQLHPDNWSPKEVLDWLYHLVGQDNTNIDENQLKGESFRDIDGATLCRWTQADFIEADPRHGIDIYENFRVLCGISADFIAPDEVTDSTGFEHQPCVNPLINDMEDGSSPIRSQLDPYLPQNFTGEVVNINGRNYPIDARDVFDDIPQDTYQVHQTSGVRTSIMHGSGGLVKQMATSISRPTSLGLNVGGMGTFRIAQGTLTSAQVPAGISSTPSTHAQHTPSKPPKGRGRGRPRKNAALSMDEGSDGEYTPNKSRPSGGQRGGPRGKRPHSNRMLHLWEFIRDLLLDDRYNPSHIRWECRKDGVFRVVRSKDVARMWGVRKQNAEMTYEKFSRSMRFCRTAEYFGEVPKDGKYPKKLCFAFGPRAHGWQPNSVVSQCYYQKQ